MSLKLEHHVSYELLVSWLYSSESRSANKRSSVYYKTKEHEASENLY